MNKQFEISKHVASSNVVPPIDMLSLYVKKKKKK
jgi:hypothetical protein